MREADPQGFVPHGSAPLCPQRSESGPMTTEMRALKGDPVHHLSKYDGKEELCWRSLRRNLNAWKHEVPNLGQVTGS